MEQTHRETGKEAHDPAQARVNLLSLPTAPSVRVWDELAEEASRYVELLERLKATPPGTSGREELEDELMGSLEHLQMHSQVLEEAVTRAVELADDLADATSSKLEDHAQPQS